LLAGNKKRNRIPSEAEKFAIVWYTAQWKYVRCAIEIFGACTIDQILCVDALSMKTGKPKVTTGSDMKGGIKKTALKLYLS